MQNRPNNLSPQSKKKYYLEKYQDLVKIRDSLYSEVDRLNREMMDLLEEYGRLWQKKEAIRTANKDLSTNSYDNELKDTPDQQKETPSAPLPQPPVPRCKHCHKSFRSKQLLTSHLSHRHQH